MIPKVTTCPGNSKAFSSFNSGLAIKNSSFDILLLKATSAIASPSLTVYFACGFVVPNSKYLDKSSDVV